MSGSLILLFFWSRRTKPFIDINPEDVAKIRYGAIEEHLETTRSIQDPRELLLFETYHDTIVYDKTVINKIVSMVNTLKPSKERDYIDSRMLFIIKMKDGTQHLFGTGYYWGIIYNGTVLEDNADLLYYLDSLNYYNHVYWYWEHPVIKESIKRGETPMPEDWNKKRGPNDRKLFK